ncbi:MAG: DNA replication and repair protein RecF [Bacteroidia bacterium]|nr:MAG: DNA replication and repair protein RecF [Bacteroidia bacterium]
MKVVSVEIRNFRNHTDTTLECGGGLNVLVGNNGEGKTNVVEAISYLSLTKSFYAASDAVVLQVGRDEFALKGDFSGDTGVRRHVEVRYRRDTARKTFLVDHTAAESLASVVGEFPVVVLSPEQTGITMGAPTERRRFLDLVIAQASKTYLQDLLEYRRILRQRNKILLDARIQRREPGDALEPWNKSLVETGSALMERRAAFFASFKDALERAYRTLAGNEEHPGADYVPSFKVPSWSDPKEIRALFEDELRQHEDEERRTGATGVGPHRDDIEFTIGGISARKFASQGQHRTLLVALKIAEFDYLKRQKGETPILLLDDVFGELDGHRSERLLEEAQTLGQVFVTTTDLRSFPRGLVPGEKTKVFEVEGGTVMEGVH